MSNQKRKKNGRKVKGKKSISNWKWNNYEKGVVDEQKTESIKKEQETDMKIGEYRIYKKTPRIHDLKTN